VGHPLSAIYDLLRPYLRTAPDATPYSTAGEVLKTDRYICSGHHGDLYSCNRHIGPMQIS